MPKARVIAFYLPQFHPVPENDEWWGKGFTEWTNVGKAKPLFRGHDQPRVPADLGYYDLRLPEIQRAQAEMARYAGVEGFAYWHYWWAGKRLLEKPFDAMLADSACTLPFCLAWANETWSGIWHGNPEKILMKQTYPGIEDHTAHFYNALKAFQDPRYIKVDGAPLFYIYRPFEIPDCREFIELWNKLAVKEGLPGIHFVGLSRNPNSEIDQLKKIGFNGINTDRIGEAKRKISGKALNALRHRLAENFSGISMLRYDYQKIVDHSFSSEDGQEGVYPTIIPQWDNSPRCGKRATIFTNSTPEKFKNQITATLPLVENRKSENQIIFLKSWNEWAEGNYVEPDQKFGWGYLDSLRSTLIA